MGLDRGQFVVWDRITDRKIQSGFPTMASARRYIADRCQAHRWKVRLFDENGLAKAHRRPPPRKPFYIKPELRAQIVARHTGRWGDNTRVAAELGISQSTVSRAMKGAA